MFEHGYRLGYASKDRVSFASSSVMRFVIPDRAEFPILGVRPQSLVVQDVLQPSWVRKAISSVQSV